MDARHHRNRGSDEMDERFYYQPGFVGDDDWVPNKHATRRVQRRPMQVAETAGQQCDPIVQAITKFDTGTIGKQWERELKQWIGEQFRGVKQW